MLRKLPSGKSAARWRRKKKHICQEFCNLSLSFTSGESFLNNFGSSHCCVVFIVVVCCWVRFTLCLTLARAIIHIHIFFVLCIWIIQIVIRTISHLFWHKHYEHSPLPFCYLCALYHIPNRFLHYDGEAVGSVKILLKKMSRDLHASSNNAYYECNQWTGETITFGILVCVSDLTWAHFVSTQRYTDNIPIQLLFFFSQPKIRISLFFVCAWSHNWHE